MIRTQGSDKEEHRPVFVVDEVDLVNEEEFDGADNRCPVREAPTNGIPLLSLIFPSVLWIRILGIESITVAKCKSYPISKSWIGISHVCPKSSDPFNIVSYYILLDRRYLQ